MKTTEIITYSFIQGISEFLPISSSAHLYAIQILYQIEIDGLTLALAAHLGTLLAVLLFEKKFIIENLNSLLVSNKENNLIMIIICVIPVLLLGFFIIIFFKDLYKFTIPSIALASIVGAILLDFSDNKKNTIKVKDALSYKTSIFIGMFQTLSLIPGMSRSGTVITAARYFGYSRFFSIKLALLTSIPIIFLSSIYGLYEVFLTDNKINYDFVYIAFITFICAYFSIKFLLKWTEYFSFRVFVIYRIFFGTFLILVALF